MKNRRQSQLPLLIVRALLLPISALVLSLIENPTLRADEFIVDSRNNDVYRLGDVNCSSCRSFPHSLLGFPEVSAWPEPNQFTFEMTAGELWRYYKEQGIDSTNQIVLYVGVDHIGINHDLILDSFEFSIDQSQQKPEAKLTQVTFDGETRDRLVIPGYETHNSKPEARMEIDLDYDFMERFNPRSQEKITLSARMEGVPDITPTFYVAGRQRPWNPPDFKLVLGFALFWVMLFWLLKLLTFRQHGLPSTHRTSAVS